MTREEARRILRNIESASSKELEAVLGQYRSDRRFRQGLGASVGTAAGALAGAATGKTPLQMFLRGLVGGTAGGAAGLGLGTVIGRSPKRLYQEIKARKDKRMADLLDRLGKGSAKAMKTEMEGAHAGIQTQNNVYGTFTSGRGVYSGDDKLDLKRDEDGRQLLSLLFAGINSSVENGGKSSAKSPFAARFYNKNRDKFSDVQANTVFDDPIIADAYIDKIVAKIMDNRAKTGRYPRVRLVGYSAGGRGVVNFLRKMRERDPKFKADEIIGIDAYTRPWERIPESLRDKSNPVAGKIVYSRPSDKYTGSSRTGIGRVEDVLSNTAVALAGKRLNGLAADEVVENLLPDTAHTDAEAMYDSALRILSHGGSNTTRSKKENA